MAKISSCLKCIFIFFSFILGIMGGLFLVLAVLSQSFEGGGDHQDRHGQLTLYISGIIILVLAIVGAFGALKENKTCLMVFQGCMAIGAFLMIGAGFQLAKERPKVELMLDNELRNMASLDNVNKKMKLTLETFQTHMNCCGINSYSDWNEVPESCECIEGNECIQLQGKSFQFKQTSIYKKPCGPIIKQYALMLVDVAIGMSFFLGVMAGIGMIMSWTMVCQLRPAKNSSIPLTTKAVSTSEPPRYQELHHPALY